MRMVFETRGIGDEVLVAVVLAVAAIAMLAAGVSIKRGAIG
jgi:hypothetical protein